jgi:hypothetical protein
MQKSSAQSLQIPCPDPLYPTAGLRPHSLQFSSSIKLAEDASFPTIDDCIFPPFSKKNKKNTPHGVILKNF